MKNLTDFRSKTKTFLILLRNNKHMKRYELDIIDSTNEYAKQLLKTSSDIIPFVVRANQQTSGKGQGNNHWDSQANKNLLCSIVVKPEQILCEEQFLISQIVAISLLDVLSEFSPKASIKWPNDLYIGHKKIAGILIENTIMGSNIAHCIIGIGLNINQKEFSKHLPNPTSLALETQQTFEIPQILEQIISKINHYFKNRENIPQKYEKHLYLKGTEHTFYDIHQQAFKGSIIGVNTIGQLLIRLSDKEQKILTFSNQEVQFNI